jgi:hypothetical protein
MRLGSRPRSCGESAGSVGRTDLRALISERRSLEASMESEDAVQRGQRQVKFRLARIEFVRRLWARFSKPSVDVRD